MPITRAITQPATPRAPRERYGLTRRDFRSGFACCHFHAKGCHHQHQTALVGIPKSWGKDDDGKVQRMLAAPGRLIRDWSTATKTGIGLSYTGMQDLLYCTFPQGDGGGPENIAPASCDDGPFSNFRTSCRNHNYRRRHTIQHSLRFLWHPWHDVLVDIKGRHKNV